MSFDPQRTASPCAKIKVIGVGGAGTNAVSTMIRSQLEGVEFIAANTDVQSLGESLAPVRIQVGKELTKGLGAGSDPDVGRDAALEDRHELQEQLSGADMVFITAGMGGGTGTGGAAVVSQIARENNALTVGVVTKPFSFEGKRRKRHAELGIERLKEHVDTLIVIPNNRLLKLATPDLSMPDAFKIANNVLVNAVRGISDIINIPGTVNVDFADVKTIMSSTGHALMGIGMASGDNRAAEAARQAISSPLLEDVDIEGATGILINITANAKIPLMEINEACSIIEDAAHEEANIIFGAVIDENMTDEIRITVIATGFPTQNQEEFSPPPAPRPSKRKEFFTEVPKRTNGGQRDWQAPAQVAPPVVEESSLPDSAELAQWTLTEQVPSQSPAPEQNKQEDITSLSPKSPVEEKKDEVSELQDSSLFGMDEQQKLSSDIDKRIDEALELAERVRGAERQEDDELDVPSFLRQEGKDFPQLKA